MVFIEWKEAYNININTCDDQHKGLIDIINNLHANMKMGKGHEVIGDIIEKLVQYTKIHFGTEERFFKDYNYPDTEKHISEHKKFVEKISESKSDLESGRILISVGLLNFLKDWLINHISIEDKKYGPFLISKGVT